MVSDIDSLRLMWQKNQKDSKINQQYYIRDGIWTIAKTCHQSEWRYLLYKGNDRIGTYLTLEEAQLRAK